MQSRIVTGQARQPEMRKGIIRANHRDPEARRMNRRTEKTQRVLLRIAEYSDETLPPPQMKQTSVPLSPTRERG